MGKPRTYVYVDGFNLYHGAVSRTPNKWLNLLALCQRLMPNNDIQKIKYFSARVSGKVDPRSPLRQETYFRALRTIANLEIHLGQFATHSVWRPIAIPRTSNPDDHQIRSRSRTDARVMDTKEKGSDVNLAVHLLNDAWQNLYDVAAIISNDSDLVTSVQMVRRQRMKKVGFINPHHKQAAELSAESDFSHQLRQSDLAASQFPPSIPGTAITKPVSW